MGWQKFEENVYKFLKNTLVIKNLTLDHKGGSDSTTSDIEFLINNKQKFVLEIKQSKSQAGQFVVSVDTKNNKFKISIKNKCNLETSAIINHMSINNYYFKEINKNNKNIDLKCDKKLMYKRVIAQMTNKSSFIASSHYHKDSNFSKMNPLIIESICELEKYFDINGTIRPKASGSQPLPKNDYGLFDNKFKSFKKKGRIYIDDPKKEKDDYYTINESNYFFSKPDSDGKREIRKISKTKNLTVIFQLTLKKEIEHTNFKNVIDALDVP